MKQSTVSKNEAFTETAQNKEYGITGRRLGRSYTENRKHLIKLKKSIYLPYRKPSKI